MTKKLFQIDPYIKAYSAVITKIDGEYLVLDETIFAPEAGGQSSDEGFINDIPMLHAENRGDFIYHKMAEIPSSFKVGDKVFEKLNWDIRFDHMQNHCGEHILSGILFTKYGIENKGFHLGADFSTLDANMKQMPENIISNIERLANEIVFAAIPINIKLIESAEEAEKLPLRKELKVSEDISVVTIDHVDCVACCCPHPSDTSQVGIIKIIRAENYKGMTRIYFKCGMRAFEDYKIKHDIVSALSKKFSSDESSLLENIKIQENKMNSIRAQLHSMRQQFASIEAERLLAHSATETAIAFEFEDKSLDDMKLIAKKLIQMTDLPILLSSVSSKAVLLTHSGSSKFKCGSIVKDFACGFGGKGGGSDTLAQALFLDIEVMRNFVKIALMSL